MTAEGGDFQAAAAAAAGSRTASFPESGTPSLYCAPSGPAAVVVVVVLADDEDGEVASIVLLDSDERGENDSLAFAGGGGEGVVSSVDALEAVVAESSGIRGDTGAPDEASEGDDGDGCPIVEGEETGGAPLADEIESRFGSGSAVPGPP